MRLKATMRPLKRHGCPTIGVTGPVSTHERALAAAEIMVSELLFDSSINMHANSKLRRSRGYAYDLRSQCTTYTSSRWRAPRSRSCRRRRTPAQVAAIPVSRRRPASDAADASSKASPLPTPLPSSLSSSEVDAARVRPPQLCFVTEPFFVSSNMHAKSNLRTRISSPWRRPGL